MFDIGFWEIAIIGVVGLVVIGPERLPGVARTLGTWVGKTRRFINQVKTDVSSELKQEELRKAIENDAGLNEIKNIMNTDHLSIEEEDEAKPEYQVKAIDDEPETNNHHKPLDDEPETNNNNKPIDDEPKA